MRCPVHASRRKHHSATRSLARCLLARPPYPIPPCTESVPTPLSNHNMVRRMVGSRLHASTRVYPAPGGADSNCLDPDLAAPRRWTTACWSDVRRSNVSIHPGSISQRTRWRRVISISPRQLLRRTAARKATSTCPGLSRSYGQMFYPTERTLTSTGSTRRHAPKVSLPPD